MRNRNEGFATLAGTAIKSRIRFSPTPDQDKKRSIRPDSTPPTA